MQAIVGDIVELRGRRWVVALASGGSPAGPPYARLVRPNGSFWNSHLARLEGLEAIERPAFEIGEPVVVGLRSGTVAALMGDEVRVEFDPARSPFRGGGFHVHAGRSDVPRWQLVLENRMENHG